MTNSTEASRSHQESFELKAAVEKVDVEDCYL